MNPRRTTLFSIIASWCALPLHAVSEWRKKLWTAASGMSALAIAISLIIVPSGGASPVVAGRTFTSLAASLQSVDGYSPAQLETAYNIAPLLNQGINGTGQTIALIELDRFRLSDIQQFDAQYNLPDPTIQQFYAGGKAFSLPNQGETTLDLEWAHALAPGAKIQIYYLRNQQVSASGWKAIGQVVNSAVANGAGTISLSFGTCGPTTGYSATRQALAKAMARGVGVFVASGDTGAFPGPIRECGKKTGAGYPASDPSVVSVGGTSLVLNPDNTISDESAWDLSGGGKGKPLPRPVWQVTSNLTAGKYRFVPDVSFLGDPQTGVAVYLKGDWQTVGGTSLGAPAWAGIWSLVRQDASRAGKTVTGVPALMYRISNSSAYSQAFNDITEGSNGYYGAKHGWDAITGWGTPNVAGLAATILAISLATP